MPLMLVQLGLEALEQSEGIRRTAGKTGKNFVMIDTPHLARRGFNHNITERHLAVAAHGDTLSPTHGQNCRSVVLLHDCLLILRIDNGRQRIQTNDAE